MPGDTRGYQGIPGDSKADGKNMTGIDRTNQVDSIYSIKQHETREQRSTFHRSKRPQQPLRIAKVKVFLISHLVL